MQNQANKNKRSYYGIPNATFFDKVLMTLMFSLLFLGLFAPIPLALILLAVKIVTFEQALIVALPTFLLVGSIAFVSLVTKHDESLNHK